MKTTSQQIPIGYKQTDIGIIPQDWYVVRIDNHVIIKTGSKNTQDHVVDGKYPFFVRSQTIERINSYSFDGEAVLTAGDGVGTGKVFHYINGKFDVHQRVYRMTNFSDDLYGHYFFFQFSARFYDRIMSMTAKSSVDSVRREMIAGMLIPLPQKEEQIAIVNILTDTDDLIEKLEKLICKKKAIKQGAMQELLSGKRRLPGFNGEWDEKKLFVLAEFLKGTGLTKGKLTLSGKYKCILYGELFTTYSQVIKNIVSRTDYKEGLVSKKGDILMPGSTTTVGIDLATASTLNEDGVLIGGDTIIIRKRDAASYNSEFLANYLTFVSKNKIADIAQGITIIHLHGSRLQNIVVCIPKYVNEQGAIADVLSDMDSEINYLEKELEKYHLIKIGMMQLLLTGKIRIYGSN